MSEDNAEFNKFFFKTDIDSKLLISNINELILTPQMVYVNSFDENSAKEFAVKMAKIDDNKQDIIPIIIDSFGGDVYSLLSMIDTINRCRTKVATIVLGKAMSCGAVLFSMGAEGFRFMGANSTLLIHNVHHWVSGKVDDLKIETHETNRLNKLIYKILANNTGHPDDYFIKIVREKGNIDWYLTAKEAKKHNLANHIKIPQFNITIKADINFV